VESAQMPRRKLHRAGSCWRPCCGHRGFDLHSRLPTRRASSSVKATVPDLPASASDNRQHRGLPREGARTRRRLERPWDGYASPLLGTRSRDISPTCRGGLRYCVARSENVRNWYVRLGSNSLTWNSTR
jgi:hypothetical protein